MGRWWRQPRALLQGGRGDSGCADTVDSHLPGTRMCMRLYTREVHTGTFIPRVIPLYTV